VSDSEQPDVEALQQLEPLVRALGEELAVWRRRGQLAEARLKELEAAIASGRPPESARVAALEHRNADLRSRLDTATQRVRMLIEKTQFLRQQHVLEVER